MMKIVFMGSPELAVPSLRAAHEAGSIVGVVTQPAKAKGRGRKVSPSAVALEAARLGLDTATPRSVRTVEFLEYLKGLEPDLVVVVAYGKILPPPVLTAPRLGCVNVHMSLLPELRGAAPIQWAVARGYRRTGVTLMQMDEGMDTGPILLQKSTSIAPDETAPELAGRLAVMGAEILTEGLGALERGHLAPRPQDDSRATYAPMLTKEDGLIDWTMDAGDIANRVRGFDPWPGTWSFLEGRRVLVTRARAVESENDQGPGLVLRAGPDGILTACGRGALLIEALKPEGSREMTAGEFLAGRRLKRGTGFGK